MSEHQDPEIVEIQDEWHERNRMTRRLMVVQEPEGWSVHQHTIDSVFPPNHYASVELAAARLLQLLGIGQPVTPQSHPEPVCIGKVEERHE